MITVETLKAYGANTEEGLTRCMNMEPFYLKIVGMILEDANFGKLKDAMSAGNAAAAFEAAHALKGATGNAALTPIFKPASALTELLRGNTDAPMSPECHRLAAEVLEQFERLKQL